MKKVWDRLGVDRPDLWEEDELDMDEKHLSRQDKRALLYGGFMVGFAAFWLFLIGVVAVKIWTDHQCKNRHPSPICTRFEHHFHALKPHLRHRRF